MRTYYGKIHNREITALSLKELKRRASILSTGHSYDEMQVKVEEYGAIIYEGKFYRINIKAPNGTIIYGTWR